MEKTKHKSLRLTSYQTEGLDKKWWQFRKMGRKEYGNTAIVGLLAGLVLSQYGGSVVLDVVGSVLALAGLASGFIWVVLGFKNKR